MQNQQKEVYQVAQLTSLEITIGHGKQLARGRITAATGNMPKVNGGMNTQQRQSTSMSFG